MVKLKKPATTTAEESPPAPFLWEGRRKQWEALLSSGQTDLVGSRSLVTPVPYLQQPYPL